METGSGDTCSRRRKAERQCAGLIQHLDDNTTAFVGTNGTAVKSKDGKELFVDTAGLSYDMIMNMFRNMPKSGNYFDNSYWRGNIQKAVLSVGKKQRSRL